MNDLLNQFFAQAYFRFGKLCDEFLSLSINNFMLYVHNYVSTDLNLYVVSFLKYIEIV